MDWSQASEETTARVLPWGSSKTLNNEDQARKHLRIFVACCETEEVV